MTAICRVHEHNHNHRKPMINFYNLLMFTLLPLLPIVVEQTNGMKKMKTYIEEVKKMLPGSQHKTNCYDPFKNHYEYSEKEEDRRMRQHEQAKNSAHNLRSMPKKLAEKTFSKQKQTEDLDNYRQMNEFTPISN